MPANNSTNIDLSPQAKQAVARSTVVFKMKKRDLVATVLTWFTEQDEVVQRIVLGHIPASMAPDVARMLLERLAERRGGDEGGDDQGHGAKLPDPKPRFDPASGVAEHAKKDIERRRNEVEAERKGQGGAEGKRKTAG
jgi:hypothetical protein